jgi:hypothetical protein
VVLTLHLTINFLSSVGEIKRHQLLDELNEFEERKQMLRSGSKQRHSCSRPETCQISIAELRKDLDFTFGHWMLKFPAQCVLVAEAVIWEHNVFRALKRADKTALQNEKLVNRPIVHCRKQLLYIHSLALNARIEEYLCILRENFMQSEDTKIRHRLHQLLSALITQSVHHRDVVESKSAFLKIFSQTLKSDSRIAAVCEFDGRSF